MRLKIVFGHLNWVFFEGIEMIFSMFFLKTGLTAMYLLCIYGISFPLSRFALISYLFCDISKN